MYRTDTLLHSVAPSSITACIARPARFHTQVRAAHDAFRLERRDSAMPARFHIA